MNQKPLFTIGLFADAQFADKENGRYGSRNKYFRDAKICLQKCLEEFTKTRRRTWVINLGDLYDGYNDDDPEHLYFRDQSKWPEEIKERNSKEFEEMVEIIRMSLLKDLLLVSVLGIMTWP